MSINLPLHGRGASENPPNRFIPLYREKLDTWTEEDDPAPVTQFFRDESRSVLSTNDSPDIPFNFSLNPYRGCAGMVCLNTSSSAAVACSEL
jgi:hypothetical protein